MYVEVPKVFAIVWYGTIVNFDWHFPLVSCDVTCKTRS